jgi:multiple sugar transport system permease protein
LKSIEFNSPDATAVSWKVLRTPSQWIPGTFLWSNYPDAIKYNSEQLGYIPFLVYLQNTVIVVALTVVGAVLSNALVAYSFARLRWPGRDAFFTATIATMMIPFPILMVPTFSLFRWLGWIGTFKPLWVPAFFANAFSIFSFDSFSGLSRWNSVKPQYWMVAVSYEFFPKS